MRGGNILFGYRQLALPSFAVADLSPIADDLMNHFVMTDRDLRLDGLNLLICFGRKIVAVEQL